MPERRRPVAALSARALRSLFAGARYRIAGVTGIHSLTDDHGDLARALLAEFGDRVRLDAYTRHLYATDASLYSVAPLCVVFPRHADDVVAAVHLAKAFRVPVLPRGAGTSLAGQTVGRAIVLDFSRDMHALLALDPSARRARVQPGLVQDDLNRAAAPHGLFFAPDTSTSNRATLGGMIGNNSCGSRSARYGMTIDHVESLDVVLADGSRARFAPLGESWPTPQDPTREPSWERRALEGTFEASIYRGIGRLLREQEDCIRRDMPAFWRRSGGYRLERMLPEAGPFNLTNLVVGSEGTLAVVVEATVKLVEQPTCVVSVAGHFATTEAAIDASATARDFDASAIELIDRFILDLARRSSEHAPLVAILDGDPGAILFVEFSADSPAEALATAARFESRWRSEGLVNATTRAETAAQLRRFRELRKAGLGLLTAAGEGDERSIAFVEDTAVDPARLPEYTRRFAQLLSRRGLQAGFYGHASAGCLHIRPFMDIARPGAVARVREIAEEVCGLVMEFGGMNSSEHGDGLVRSEFNRRFFGQALYGAMVQVKRTFDPEGRLNPGKKVDAPPMTEHLRDVRLPRPLPVVTHFAFGMRARNGEDSGMHRAANRCARIGECRKGTRAGGVMCPSFMATRDEEHSTRGRANALVHALSSADPRSALGDQRLHEVLDLCLECKACTAECPMGVDMATLKAETLAHYHARHGTRLPDWFFGYARGFHEIGSALAPMSNWLGSTWPARAVLEWTLGVDRRRPLPRFASETLHQWFNHRERPVAGRASARATPPVDRGPVVFFADSFTSFTEPEIGRAAIELLELAGHRVEFVGDLCCGRSFISKGLLAQARSRHESLIARLAPFARAGIPIVGVEPACVFTLIDELVSLAPVALRADARRIAGAVSLVDDRLVDAMADGALCVSEPSSASSAPAVSAPLMFHAHCHQKAANATTGSVELLRRLPRSKVEVLDAGCCGMAGSFGFEREHFDLSMRIAGLRLLPAIETAPSARIIATGASCRSQVATLGRHAEHPVVLLHEAMSGTP
jgi:FAD/FMN-containing dehydrogenase/Fe-S oxidoreductase